jgi:hypothetical protein
MLLDSSWLFRTLFLYNILSRLFIFALINEGTFIEMKDELLNEINGAA